MEELYDIFFYMSEEPKIKTITGSQFIAERYRRRLKMHTSELPADNKANTANDERSDSPFEELKFSSKTLESQEKEQERLKFEKCMLMLLLGS